MRVKRLPLVSVPRPCPVSWDTMSGGDKARLCAECSRHVYDLAAMSTHEAERLLHCGDERLCVRLTRGPDGRVVTRDRPARFRQRPWLPGIPAATLATVLATANPGLAESPANGGVRGKVTFAVIDEAAATAEILARNLETGREFRTTAGKDGAYSLPLPKGRYSVQYSEPGFEVCRLDSFQSGWLPVRVDVALSVGRMVGEVITVGGSTTLPAPPPEPRCATYKTTDTERTNWFARALTAVKRLFRAAS